MKFLTTATLLSIATLVQAGPAMNPSLSKSEMAATPSASSKTPAPIGTPGLDKLKGDKGDKAVNRANKAKKCVRARLAPSSVPPRSAAPSIPVDYRAPAADDYDAANLDQPMPTATGLPNYDAYPGMKPPGQSSARPKATTITVIDVPYVTSRNNNLVTSSFQVTVTSTPCTSSSDSKPSVTTQSDDKLQPTTPAGSSTGAPSVSTKTPCATATSSSKSNNLLSSTTGAPVSSSTIVNSSSQASPVPTTSSSSGDDYAPKPSPSSVASSSSSKAVFISSSVTSAKPSSSSPGAITTTTATRNDGYDYY